jgi:hypothetical protein
MNGATSADRIEAREKASRALELRKGGSSLQAIASEVGFKSASGAHNAISRALSRLTSEPADALRKLQDARLDQLLSAVWPLAIGQPASGPFGLDSPAVPPDLKSIAIALKIMARQAALHGFDSKPEPAPIVLCQKLEDALERAYGDASPLFEPLALPSPSDESPATS